MSQNHHFPHFIHLLLENLPPIKEKKNPFVAGVLGFMCGGIGLGLYLGTWQDFLFPILIFIMLSILLVHFIVLGPFLAGVFACLWGVVRAIDSGEQR